MNGLIVRGTYEEFCVVFNVDSLDGEIVRKLKLLAAHLQSADLGVTSAFLYHDPSRSRYFFEQSVPERGLRIKRLFGRERLMVTVSGRRYLYDPTVFSQINLSALPALCDTVDRVLGEGGTRLIDLYCGYGLFSHHLVDRFGEIVGIDGNDSAIRCAERNTRLNPGRARRTFVASDITGRSLLAVWRRLRPAKETVLLDPPRQGTAPGVITCVAARGPMRAVHLFCSVDEIPRALAEWTRGGYSPERIVPLDLFPGTPNLEVAVGLRSSLRGWRR